MRVFWAALCVAVFACVLTFPVRAADTYTNQAIVCDTAEQMALFGSLVDERGDDGAMAAVNDDAKDPTACVQAVISYAVVKTGASVSIAGRNWVVTEVLVGAVAISGVLTPIVPKSFYVLSTAEGRPA